MAPWPEQSNEPKAPDKNSSSTSESEEAPHLSLDNMDQAKEDILDKQKEVVNSDVTKLDDGQLKALLDEAITYKCPKDREGKSNLFQGKLDLQEMKVFGSKAWACLLPKSNKLESRTKEAVMIGCAGYRLWDLVKNEVFISQYELLQEVESDENKSGEFARALKHSDNANSSRHCSGNRRRRRDGTVSERQSRGGSLQNLVQALNSEYESGYFTTGHYGSNSKKRNRRYSSRETNVNVSARQLEGGSLPSNVNVGDSHLISESTLNEMEFLPGCSRSSRSSRAEGTRHSSFPKICLQTRCEYSTFPTPIYSSPEIVDENSEQCFPKSEYVLSNSNIDDASSDDECQQNVYLKDADKKYCDSYIYKVNNFQESDDMNFTDNADNAIACCSTSIDPLMQVNYTSHARLEVGNGLNDTSDDLEIENHIVLHSLEMSDDYEENVEHATLQLPSNYSSVKCIMGGTNETPEMEQANKSWEIRASVVYCTSAELLRKVNDDESDDSVVQKNVFPTHMSVLSIPPNHSWLSSQDPIGKLTFSGNKDVMADTKANKTLDENGNALSQNYRLEPASSGERKSKQRRMKTSNDRNVILSHHIEGYRGDIEDIETLIKFIESDSDSKNKSKPASHNHTNVPNGLGNKQSRSGGRKDENPSTGKNRRDTFSDLDKGIKCRPHGGKHSAKDKNSGRTSGLKKSNSLEELSKTNLEDLGLSATSTSESVKDFPSVERLQCMPENLLDHNSLRDPGFVNSRRSWGSDGQCAYSYVTPQESTAVKVHILDDDVNLLPSNSNNSTSISEQESLSLLPVPVTEELDFHIVTKKQRRKKRRSISRGRTIFYSGDSKKSVASISQINQLSNKQYQNKDNITHIRKPITRNEAVFSPHIQSSKHGMIYPYHHHHHHSKSPEHRRCSASSMPPSDKSDCSDLDSVHSLPASTTIPGISLEKTSTSSGSTPLASYADITRMASTHSSSSSSNSNITHNVKIVEINSTKFVQRDSSVLSEQLSSSKGSTNVPLSRTVKTVSSNYSNNKMATATNSCTDFNTQNSKSSNFQNVNVTDESKKDAMTSTTLDNKAISSSLQDCCPYSDIHGNPNKKHNNLKDCFPTLNEMVGSNKYKVKPKNFTSKSDSFKANSSKANSSKANSSKANSSKTNSSKTNSSKANSTKMNSYNVVPPSVTCTKTSLHTGTLNSSNLAPPSVTCAKTGLHTGTVNSSNVVPPSVTCTKTSLHTGTVNSSNVVPPSVTCTKTSLHTGTVNSSNVVPPSVTSTKTSLHTGTVNSTNVIPPSVTCTKTSLYTGTVNSSNVVPPSVTCAKTSLSTGTVNSCNVAPSSVTCTKTSLNTGTKNKEIIDSKNDIVYEPVTSLHLDVNNKEVKSSDTKSYRTERVSNISTVSQKNYKVKNSSKSKTATTKNLVPVILLDEKKWRNLHCDRLPSPSEVTFGFEVNEQLLSNEKESNKQGGLSEDSVKSVEKANSYPTSSCIIKVVPNGAEITSTLVQQPYVSAVEHQRIVNFVGSRKIVAIIADTLDWKQAFAMSRSAWRKGREMLCQNSSAVLTVTKGPSILSVDRMG